MVKRADPYPIFFNTFASRIPPAQRLKQTRQDLVKLPVPPSWAAGR